MTIEGDALLLRVYIGESDTHDGRPLYDAVSGRFVSPDVATWGCRPPRTLAIANTSPVFRSSTTAEPARAF